MDSSSSARPSISDKVRSIDPIDDLNDLRRHLQLAIEIEHATMPPYLTALYSLREEDGRNYETHRLIRRVVIEEMLHLALACNVLNAVGGHPRLAFETFTPEYPIQLPQSDTDYIVHLERCSDDALDTFLKVELPAYPLPERLADVGYRTIGEFYENLQAGLTRLTDAMGPDSVFTGDRGRQLTSGYYDRPGLVEVINLAAANQALDIVIHQGEGAQAPNPDVPTASKPHYFLFRDIRDRTIRDAACQPLPREEQFTPEAVAPTVKDPRLMGGTVRDLSRPFDETYSGLLRKLDRVFNGYPGEIGEALGIMGSLRTQAAQLMSQPLGDGQNASPTFYYYER